MKKDQKFRKYMSCEHALGFEQWRTFSGNYKLITV